MFDGFIKYNTQKQAIPSMSFMVKEESEEKPFFVPKGQTEMDDILYGKSGRRRWICFKFCARQKRESFGVGHL